MINSEWERFLAKIDHAIDLMKEEVAQHTREKIELA